MRTNDSLSGRIVATTKTGTELKEDRMNEGKHYPEEFTNSKTGKRDLMCVCGYHPLPCSHEGPGIDGRSGRKENSVNHPTVIQARAICDQLKARGVILLAFTPDGNVAGACYGKTEEERRMFGLAMDGIINAIHHEEISIGKTPKPIAKGDSRGMNCPDCALHTPGVHSADCRALREF